MATKKIAAERPVETVSVKEMNICCPKCGNKDKVFFSDLSKDGTVENYGGKSKCGSQIFLQIGLEEDSGDILINYV